jgi:hypothetical protein
MAGRRGRSVNIDGELVLNTKHDAFRSLQP